ncbi:MAG: L-glutamate gamma-semialdehyde dehydrogenase [Acidobacteria bacterium]|nr:L-glutamate gamma-semialdehyde dehydrogenase [Acidobacteriota bacterium]
MSNAFFKVPPPQNEPVRNYAPGSAERTSLEMQLHAMANDVVDIPIIIGGEEVRTGNTKPCVMPHDHQHVLGHYHQAGPKEIEAAIASCNQAWHTWSEMAWEDRAAVFLKAAELLAGPYRDVLNAATMLGQSKTVLQAEIDSACELIDFYRFNPHFMASLYSEQPESPLGVWNRSEYRALEGFVFSVTPFNFTSIAGNLPTAPAMMGNVSIWKPASSSVYSGYFIMKLLEEAGLPPGVINYVPGSGASVGNAVIAHQDLAGVHFTGSTGVFQGMWRSIGENIARYRSYPRIVGETGGKDFIFAHESADIDALAIAILRGAFEYQGQKCSAASRVYVPKKLWSKLKPRLLAEMETVTQGDVRDFSNFMSAVIDRGAFNSISDYVQHAKQAADATVIFGGTCDDRKGFYIEPTVIETSNPSFKTMCEEIFGPVVTIYPYDMSYEEALDLCDRTSPYALTGAIFAQDRGAIAQATRSLRHAAGNFYINDKPTGAVVGQQPFGGGRASGTNDKAGSKINLLKWVNSRSIKETFNPPKRYDYPHMRES